MQVFQYMKQQLLSHFWAICDKTAKNIVLKKFGKNIFVPLPIGSELLRKIITLGGEEILILK